MIFVEAVSNLFVGSGDQREVGLQACVASTFSAASPCQPLQYFKPLSCLFPMSYTVPCVMEISFLWYS